MFANSFRTLLAILYVKTIRAWFDMSNLTSRLKQMFSFVVFFHISTFHCPNQPFRNLTQPTVQLNWVLLLDVIRIRIRNTSIIPGGNYLNNSVFIYKSLFYNSHCAVCPRSNRPCLASKVPCAPQAYLLLAPAQTALPWSKKIRSFKLLTVQRYYHIWVFMGAPGS